MSSRWGIRIGALTAVIASAVVVYYLARSRKPAVPIGQPVAIVTPLGLPPVPVPADNPETAETIALGKRLYFEKALSIDKSVSCASCHEPDQGFAYAQAVATGVGGKKGTRNAPTVLNAAYYTTMFWDGREPSLEKQAEAPVQNPVEMAHTLKGAVARLAADPSYVAMFQKAYGPGAITYEKVEKAIAAFERTAVSGNAPFDRWFYGGDEHAVSDSVKRGFDVFRRADKGNCAACHALNDNYALFTDNQFHNIGVGVKDDNPTDLGRYNVTHLDADRGAFKTPSLRNVAETAPYMHDGSLKTLKDVVDFYVGGGTSSPWRDAKMKELHLTAREKADLIAFMQSLTGDVPQSLLPEKSVTKR
jgi:cytochrome c peroxidase